MLTFAEALPRIRERTQADLGLPGLPRNKVLATVVTLLERTLIRVGNEEYAQQNDSFGLTTMRDHHVEIEGSTMRFRFRGKSGKEHDVGVTDKRLARIVARCQDVPGDELFQYIDESGERQTVESSDVNDYLREISGEDFTAKDFRTWAGTVLALRELLGLEPWHSKLQAKRNLVQVIKTVAERLGNTPSVCRKCYVHPAVMEAYLDGVISNGEVGEADRVQVVQALHGEEARLLGMLQMLAHAKEATVGSPAA